jgi:hypothetical protein
MSASPVGQDSARQAGCSNELENFPTDPAAGGLQSEIALAFSVVTDKLNNTVSEKLRLCRMRQKNA